MNVPSSNNIVTSKRQIKPLLKDISNLYSLSTAKFYSELNDHILSHKVKFPILEYIAVELESIIPAEQTIPFLRKIIDYNQIASYVISGKILQNRLDTAKVESFELTKEFMIKGNEWYTCDILSERVPGMGLLKHFDFAIGELEKFQSHDNKWIRRSPGIAVHLAVKWGLPKDKIKHVIDLLFNQLKTKDYHVKKGCGWGIETISKFHPDIISEHSNELNAKSTNAWIRYKHKLGLKKSKALKNKMVRNA